MILYQYLGYFTCAKLFLQFLQLFHITKKWFKKFFFCHFVQNTNILLLHKVEVFLVSSFLSMYSSRHFNYFDLKFPDFPPAPPFINACTFIRSCTSIPSFDISLSMHILLSVTGGRLRQPHRFVPTWFENVPPDLVTALHLFTYHACFLISLFQSSAATLAKHNVVKSFTNSHLNFLRLQFHKIFYCAIWRKNISWNSALFEHKNVTSWRS